MSLFCGEVHEGRVLSEKNVSGSFFWQPAKKTAIAHRIQSTEHRPNLVLLEPFAGNVIFFIVANNYYVIIFNDFVRTVITRT